MKKFFPPLFIFMFLANIVSIAQIPGPVNLTVDFKQYFPIPSWGGCGFVELTLMQRD